MALSKFSRWYKKNGSTLNKKRRARYRTDLVYRKRQLLSTKRWRNRTDKERKANPPAPVPKTEFTIGEAAEKIGCNIQTIRLLERNGLLPPATDGRSHRLYTKKQIALVGLLISYRQKNHYKVRGYDKTVKMLSKRVFKEW